MRQIGSVLVKLALQLDKQILADDEEESPEGGDEK